jgi:hypothetical protein
MVSILGVPDDVVSVVLKKIFRNRLILGACLDLKGRKLSSSAGSKFDYLCREQLYYTRNRKGYSGGALKERNLLPVQAEKGDRKRERWRKTCFTGTW